jgi:CrcB protein
MINILAVFIGGGLGSLARYGVSNAVANTINTTLPFATLFSNIASCLILGAGLYFYPEKIAENSMFRLLLITGFCGGFSTFSTFSFETVELFRSGNIFYGIANIAVSVITCSAILYFLISSKTVN